ncbi:MAG: vWA domain-containing protein [Flavobacteriales bacterium]
MNLKIFLLIFSFFFLIENSANAQLAVNPQKLNFGDVTKDTDMVVDIIIENKSSKPDLLLRSTFSNEFEVKFSTKQLEPNGQLVVRLKFNPRKKGVFQEVGELYFASMSTPIQIPISAKVLYVNVNGNTPCPDFSTRAADCCSKNFFLVEVYDADTNEPIEGAFVRLEEEGYLHLRLKTNNEGKVSNEARIGFYELSAEKEGYDKKVLSSYVNNANAKFVFYLKRNSDPSTGSGTEEKDIEREQEVEVSLELPVDRFVPNNVVFLLDISGSMGVGDKLELMQYSLQELVSVLRSVDRMALVSYAGDATVLQATTSGTNKQELREIVAGIRTGGKTSGAKGFKKAYQLLQKSKIQGGNNQLIVITDGAFAVEDQKDIEKMVKRYAAKGYETTVVAIEANNFAKDKLGFVSQLGNGSFLQVEDKTSAERVLIEELKKQSAK